MIKSKKQMFIVISVFTLVLFFGSISYAWFTYGRETTNQQVIMGDFYVRLDENNDEIELSNLFPETKEEARARDDNYMTFSINSKNTSNKTLFYEIILDHGTAKPSPKDRYHDDELRFDLVELDSNGNEVDYLLSDVGYSTLINKSIYVDTLDAGTSNQVTRRFKLRVWLDESVIISDTATNPNYTTSDYKNRYATIKVIVAGDFEKRDIYASSLVKKAIINKQDTEYSTCTRVTIDIDDVIYLSGNSTCIDFNYVWYSGKLWRITAIYPDGAMKLVTANSITNISFNESGNPTFKDNNTSSYMYQWLNEDFYDTLYRPTDFIDTTKEWDVTETSGVSTNPGGANTVAANVGLLNSFEYYNSYRCVGSFTNCNGNTYASGYLNTLYYWKLLNPYSSTVVWQVNSSGSMYTGADTNTAQGVRPSIVLKSTVRFTGDGTLSSPFRIMGDKPIGNADEPINTRLSGEYVLLKNGNNEELFRIIGVEDNKTKLIAVDYANSSGTRRFATSGAGTLWGSGTTTDSGTWYDYLKNTYLPNLRSTYGDLFDSGTYYLGTTGYNYKLAVCASATSDTTKTCTKTTDILPNSSNTDPVYVGLPRYGEMFAAQEREGYSTSVNTWLINRYSSSTVWNVGQYGSGSAINATNQFGARPTIHLKNNVVIKSGSGTKSDPYVVKLQTS